MKARILYAILLMLFLLAALWIKRGLDMHDSFIALEQNPNHHIVFKTRDGIVYREENTSNGVVHGTYISCSPQHPEIGLRGQFHFGVRIGEWTDDYPDGTLMSRETYGAPYCITSEWSGSSRWKSNLLNGQYYSPDGSLYSIVDNGVGVKSEFSRRIGVKNDLKSLAWSMVGYPTNYSVAYFLKPFQDFMQDGEFDECFPIMRYSSTDINCTFGRAGEVKSVRQRDETGCVCDRIFDEQGLLTYEYGPIPPFLLGSPLVMPSYDEGIIRFNVQITFSNGVAHLSKIPPQQDDIHVLP